jgi:hypothetical protein
MTLNLCLGLAYVSWCLKPPCSQRCFVVVYAAAVLLAGRLRAAGMPAEKAAVALSSLERFYGIKQLADNKATMAPLELR